MQTKSQNLLNVQIFKINSNCVFCLGNLAQSCYKVFRAVVSKIIFCESLSEFRKKSIKKPTIKKTATVFVYSNRL